MSELKIPKFDQIGILVKDLDKAVKILENLLVFKSKLNILEQSSEVNYKGQDATIKMKKVMQHFGDKQLEIVELLDATGPNLYTEFIESNRFGLHHLGIYTKKAEELIKYFKENYNVGVIQHGKVGRVKFYYLDTEDVLGFIIELIQI